MLYMVQGFCRFFTLVVVFIFGSTTNKGFAQTIDFNSDFEFVVDIIKRDYAGYFDRMQGRENYIEQIKKSIYQQKKNCNGSELCQYLLLKEFLNRFNDPHLNYGFNNDSLKRSRLFNNKNPFFEKRVVELYNEKAKHKFSVLETKTLCGEWTDENNYKVRISKLTDYLLVGTVTAADSIYWFTGQTKFILAKKDHNKFNCLFLGRDHFFREIEAIHDNGEIVLDKYGRLFKGVNFFNTIANFYFDTLTDGVSYLRLPDFFPSNANKIDSIIAVNKRVLHNSQYLLIDIRNNPGGSSKSYQGLLNYIITDKYTISGSKYRKSKRNISFIENLSMNNVFDSTYKNLFSSIADSLRNSSTPFYEYVTDYAMTPDTIYSFPKKIVFIVNQRTISSAEILVDISKSSSKCLVVGQTTYGAMAYQEINNSTYLPCGFIRINYAMARSNRIDKQNYLSLGIVPSIKLNSNSSNWIKEILQLIKAKKL